MSVHPKSPAWPANHIEQYSSTTAPPQNTHTFTHSRGRTIQKPATIMCQNMYLCTMAQRHWAHKTHIWHIMQLSQPCCCSCRCCCSPIRGVTLLATAARLPPNGANEQLQPVLHLNTVQQLQQNKRDNDSTCRPSGPSTRTNHNQPEPTRTNHTRPCRCHSSPAAVPSSCQQ